MGVPEVEYDIADHRLVPGAVSAVGYRARGQAEGSHLGVPSASLTFILSLDGPVVVGERAADLTAGRTTSAEVLLAGLHLRAVHVQQPSDQEGVQVAVDPLACRALFGCPVSELTATGGEDVLGRRGRQLWQQVGETSTWAGRMAVVADALRQWAGTTTTRAPRPEVVAAWRVLRRHHGAVRVEVLARSVTLSPRQLRTEFTRELGVGPKGAARLMRLDRVTGQLAGAVRRGTTPVLADVAATCGYADQAHLARDVRDLLGVPPSAWLAGERRNIQAGGHAEQAGWAS